MNTASADAKKVIPDAETRLWGLTALKKADVAAAKPVIFNARDVAARLAALKKAAVKNGKEDSAWWQPALHIEWTSCRKGNNGTQWVNVSFTDASGVTDRLNVRVNGERHIGQIMPASDAGVAELAARVKNPNANIEKRTKKVSIQILKWNARVKTAEDGVTVLADADGQPMLPGDEMLSPYYEVACLVGEAFTSEAKERVDRGLALLTKAAEMKRADKVVTAQTVVEAFTAANGPRRPGDMILSSESVGAFRKLFPAQKDTDLLTKGAAITSNVKIANLVQEYISDRAKKNAGLPLPNPMTRVAMDFDGATGIAKLLFDKSAPYMVKGKQAYEIARVDGDPVNVDNVHKFMLNLSSLDGIFSLNSVCFSNMGISMPVKAGILVVDRPSSREVSLDDVYDVVYAAPAPAADVEEKAPETAAPRPATRAAPAAAAPAEENYDDLLGELGGV